MNIVTQRLLSEGAHEGGGNEYTGNSVKEPNSNRLELYNEAEKEVKLKSHIELLTNEVNTLKSQVEYKSKNK